MDFLKCLWMFGQGKVLEVNIEYMWVPIVFVEPNTILL